MISKQYIAEIALRREAVESFDRYPFSLAAVRPLERLKLHPAVTFFVGENGSGKSTLLEAIAVACGFNAEGGSKNFRFDTRNSHSELHRRRRSTIGSPATFYPIHNECYGCCLHHNLQLPNYSPEPSAVAAASSAARSMPQVGGGSGHGR